MPTGMVVLSLVLLALGPPAAADPLEDARPIALTPEEVAVRWHARLDARHFVARITLEMGLAGLREQRQLQVWRDDEGGKAERVLIRFESPPDLRDVGLLYLEQRGRPNDYFLYQPELQRVRRLPDSVASEDVYGIELEFLGFGVAHTEPTEIESLTGETIDGRATYRLTERARRQNPRFERRITWLDRETFIPLRTEHHLRGQLRLVATTLETRAIQGVPTPLRMRFERPSARRHVELVVESVDYESAIPAEYFSTLALVHAHAHSVPVGR